MTFDARKLVELESKCAAFNDELDAWKGSLPALPKHTSQIRRLTALFEPLAGKIAERIEAAGRGDVAARGYELGAEVLVLFRIWAFYRQKLSQRFVPWHRDVLDVADEIAFRFWRPARDAALAAAPPKARARLAKEPPLVFFNGDVSPYTMTRKSAFEPEQAEGLEADKIAWASKVLRRSPVPVIGVPYFATRHPPDLMVLAHEVGHNVEDDFGLSAELEAALDRALEAEGRPASRREAWRAWAGEVFADVWGVLTGGPAFVGALTDFIAHGKGEIEAEAVDASDWGLYPTTIVRAELLFCALRALDLGAEAGPRREAFRDRYRKNAMADFEPDAELVVKALLACKPKAFGVSVREASGFKPGEFKKVAGLANDLVAGRTANDPNTARIAQAAALAFSLAPAELSQAKRVKALWENLRETVTKGARSSDKRPVDEAALGRHDVGVAGELFDELTRPPS
jgi:hypothetical protein